MARVNIPDAQRVADVKGHIEEVTAQLQKEAAEQAEKEKQAQEASRAAQQKGGMAAVMATDEEEGGTSGTDVLDLTDPEGYFARLQRRLENEAREAEPAVGEKAQPEMSGKAMAAKGKQKKAPAMGKEPAGKETSGKEAPEGSAAREADEGPKAQPDEKVSTGPMDAAQKKVEKTVKLRTDPKEGVKDLTNASKEDIGQRVSGAVAKAHIAREKAMTTAQLLFYSAREQSMQHAGEKRGNKVPGNEKADTRREGNPPSADKGQQRGMAGAGDAGRTGRQPAKETDKSHAPSVNAASLADNKQPAKAVMDHAATAKTGEGKAQSSTMEKQASPAPTGRTAGEKLRSDTLSANMTEAARAGMDQAVNTGRAVTPGAEQAARPDKKPVPANARDQESQSTHGAKTPGMETGAGATIKMMEAARTGMGQPSISGTTSMPANAGKQESRNTQKAKVHKPEMGVTSQGKVFERFNLDKALSNAYDTSKAYGNVMEMATFTHTNGRPVSVTHNGDTLKFEKDKEGNTFAYINGTKVEPLDAARFLVRYDRETMGGAAVLAARLQLALRDPFQKGLFAPAKAPVPSKGKEAERGKGREGKAEKPSRGGREAGTGR